ncbi:TetR/AcrR family transcriptional regulator [Candidatus Bipolaricaulota bacterium]|nr:TetR/AcrR family transcriptional regulator [Candidatus Bipolaricaulota bacterium]
MNRKSTEKRQVEIIEATLDLLAEKGTQNLTMAHIAEKVGISEAALYRHFSDKFDIIGSSIEYVGEKMRSEISKIPEGKSAVEELKRIFLQHVQYIERHPGNARLLFSDEIHFDDKELKQLLKNVVEGRKNYIEEVISQGQSDGTIRTDVESEGLALIFIGLIQAKVLLWSLSDRDFSLYEQGKEMWGSLEAVLAE